MLVPTTCFLNYFWSHHHIYVIFLRVFSTSCVEARILCDRWAVKFYIQSMLYFTFIMCCWISIVYNCHWIIYWLFLRDNLIYNYHVWISLTDLLWSCYHTDSEHSINWFSEFVLLWRLHQVHLGFKMIFLIWRFINHHSTLCILTMDYIFVVIFTSISIQIQYWELSHLLAWKLIYKNFRLFVSHTWLIFGQVTVVRVSLRAWQIRWQKFCLLTIFYGVVPRWDNSLIRTCFLWRAHVWRVDWNWRESRWRPSWRIILTEWI